MGVTAAGARLGNLTLAVNIIVMQYFQFFSFFIDGFAYSGEAMVGLRMGEMNYPMLKSCVKRLLQWTVGTGILFSIGYFIGIESITSLLTNSENVLDGVLQLTAWVALIPVVSCIAFIFDGFYVGITNTFKMMLSSLIGGVCFFALLSLEYTGSIELNFLQGNHLIWSAFLGYLLVRGAYLALMWRSALKRQFRALNVSSL